ncbi:MAG: hypothetical protein NXI24_19040 [bacterium]|nr:hypothetical protein [bacterium]
MNESAPPNDEVRGLLQSLITDSRRNAERTRRQSYIFLILGVLLAIGGLAYYGLRIPARVEYKDLEFGVAILKIAVKYGPHVGTLFFVELIAFFMLRQFRMLTEDYRYFEAIVRRREANLTVYLLADRRKKSESDWPQIVKHFQNDEEFVRPGYGETKTKAKPGNDGFSDDDLDFVGKFAQALRSIWRP